jgi:protein disulfide-isomerase A6
LGEGTKEKMPDGLIPEEVEVPVVEDQIPVEEPIVVEEVKVEETKAEEPTASPEPHDEL